MIVPLLASAWEGFAIGFGAATAVLMVGGVILLRWQRNRIEQSLAQSALEKGDPPPSQPLWLASLRQGVLTIALGAGVCLCGWAARLLADRIELPTLPTTRPTEEMLSGAKPRDEQGRLTSEGRLYTLVRSRWERQQNQKTVGLVLLGCGGVLILLGLARAGFALVERRYAVGERA